MRVLDLDMDFFLADCCPLAPKGERPVLQGHEPWEEQEVRSFLEQRCGLSREHPIPGSIFETHDMALQYWNRKMREGKLSAPFSVTHVDAHSDLGIGKPGPGFVLNGVLPRHLNCRAQIQEYYDKIQLDEANYLLFALSFRWISELDNVRNPKSRKDIPQELLLPGRTDVIQLSSFASRLMEPQNGKEPEIPFHVYHDYKEFRTNQPYDFATMAISPRYAPAEADYIAEIFSEYIYED